MEEDGEEDGGVEDGIHRIEGERVEVMPSGDCVGLHEVDDGQREADDGESGEEAAHGGISVGRWSRG